MIHSKQHRGTHGYRWCKTADFSHGTGTAHGAPPLCPVGGAPQAQRQPQTRFQPWPKHEPKEVLASTPRLSQSWR